jgi:hypothetical protein
MGLSVPISGLSPGGGLSRPGGLSAGGGLSPDPFAPVGGVGALLLTTGDYLLLTDGGKLLLASAVSPIPSTALGWGSDALEWGAGDYITWG